jgi:pimeloyl-ACP methyl ester carboxylesterase/membrane protein DedA with SNARE-associated domain
MSWLRRVRWWHVYLPLLALSHAAQLLPGRAVDPPTDLPIVEVARQAATGAVGGEPVSIAYRDMGQGAPVVYLHGSPGSGSDAAGLARELAAGFRVVAPDLPGFGASTRWIPDYGIEAHARYVLELMDALGLERAHLVTHSMGSGVAYFVAHLAPERVASITSYAGIGTQEGEGSGDYYLEHLKYAAGFASLVVVPEVVPHFGLLGERSARHAFIRNFWDTDQRPIRGILEELETPLLILHGRDDPLVPVRAAEEHHRIVEHSELVVLDASHFLVFSRSGSQRLAAEIRPFLERFSDPESAPARRTVDESGGPDPAEPFAAGLDVDRRLGPWAHVAIFFWGTFVSEDLTCISAGLLVRAARVDLFVAVLGCFLGIFIGDIGLWVLGRAVGRRVLRWRWISRRVQPARVDRFGEMFDRHIGKAVFGSRFLPGTRVPMYIAAGIVSRRPLAFFVWLFFAALVWTPSLVVLAIVLGPLAARPFEAIAGVGWLSWGAAALCLFVLQRILFMATSWRGRVRLAAAVTRLWRPEFWPAWLFYLPLLPWIAALAVRHGGLTTPTSANPAIPHGGFVGESKFAILSGLPRERIVPSHLVEPGAVEARLASLRGLVEGGRWELPLVLKPDEGQRGAGLKLAREWSEVEGYVRSHERAILAQPYDPGPHEAGVFYYRIPGEPRGRIFSITDKRFPEVTGDGRSTLEELILRDPRLRMQAGVFARRLAPEFDDVLPEGERRRLAVAGNHCQGTMFLDGSHLVTAELEQSIDAVAREYAGFFFGRFDVRYGDVRAFKKGDDYRIVELNGVTSESTDVYDPSFGLLRGYRTLGRQWGLAFRIGAENRRRGHHPSSIVALFRAARRHYRGFPDGVSD